MVKWVRVKRCSSANTLNEKLCVFSSKLDESINQVEDSSQMSKKKNNAHILIVCWLYFVNGGLAHSICCLDLDKHVTVIQEPILLMWWRKKVIRSFGKWLMVNINEVVLKNQFNQSLIVSEVVRDIGGS